MGQLFFCFGQGRAEEKIFGLGWGKLRANSGHFRGGVMLGSLENFRGWGGLGQPVFLGASLIS